VTRPIVWSEAARALFDLVGPTAVSAGAGSGKTTCLVELCVRLLSGEATGRPCDPAELVAITFTEKAALELEERLRAAVLARAAASAGEEARVWHARLHGLERMAIGTIHGFAGRLLREHALEAGVDPDFEVLDEATAEAWRRAAARAEVLAALDAGRPVALELCGAQGAGGRRPGLADVVHELVRERATLGDASPPRPTPEDPAAARGALARAVAAADAVLALSSRIGSQGGRAALERLATARGAVAPGELEAATLDQVQALAAALKGWRVAQADGPGAREAKDALAAACATFEPLAADVLAAPQKRELCALLAGAEARYAAAKRAARALDFDDLLARARDLLRDDAGLRAELRGRLAALLVDEYQDVNPVQQELFELVAGDGGGDGPRPLLVAVGDLKQSIYRFRGADVAVFRGVLDCFRGARGARVLHLSANHRSSPAVLELVNEVFARCMQPSGPDARPYELAFGASDRLEPVRRATPGPACELLDDPEDGLAAERREREARAVAARIAAIVRGAAGVEVRERGEADEERGRRPRFGDVAVLFRRLTEVAEYERALREAGIPYRLARGGGFYRAPEVRDLGELLVSLAAPDDALAWAALLRSPLCGVSEGTLFALSREPLPALARRAPEEVVAALVARHPDAARPAAWDGASTDAERLERFLRAWQALRPLQDRLPPAAVLARAVDALDLEAAHLAAPDGERRVANLRKALALAERFGEGGGTAAAFGERLRHAAGRAAREGEAELEAGDAVALLSVHQAKGLEWPIVFVPDLGAAALRDHRRAARAQDGAIAAAFLDVASDTHWTSAGLAAAREEGKRAAAAESRRLLYVALTRARDRLVLSGEAGRQGETWRALIEGGVASRPELVVRIPYAEVGGEGAEAGGPSISAAETPLPNLPSAARGEGPAILAGPAPLRAVRLAVTDLAEHARCPRRVYLGRLLGLPERPPRVVAVQDDPERATARGTLAHAMLAEADLGAPPLERRGGLCAAAERRGLDPRAPGVRRILGDVLRFLDSAAGRRLAAAARADTLRREVPFLLRLPGDGVPDCYLSGAIDALVDTGREVAVIDFKYAIGGEAAGERYRFQLLAYALAASRALPGRPVTARVQFLRGACTAVDVTPRPAELARFAREAPRLALAAHAGTELARAPGELGRTSERCEAEGCGFVGRCFGGRAPP
jgi:ATP-dependent exoDNAse (exonuclease V) beta subunit